MNSNKLFSSTIPFVDRNGVIIDNKELENITQTDIYRVTALCIRYLSKVRNFLDLETAKL